MKNSRNKKGFTLTELMVVLVIMAIIAAIAVPSFINYWRRAEFRKNEENAKTIYLAAESKLTYYRSSGQWDQFQKRLLQEGTEAVLDDNSDLNGRIYTVMLDANTYEQKDDSKDLLLQLIDDYTYDKRILNGAIALEIDSETGEVYSAFYGTKCKGLNYASEDQNGYLTMRDRAYESRRKRLLGYYSAEDTGNVVSLKPTRLRITTISLQNSEKLSLNWSSNVGNSLDVSYELTFYNNKDKSKLFSMTVSPYDMRKSGWSAQSDGSSMATLEVRDKNGNTMQNWAFPITYSDSRYSLVLDAMMSAKVQAVLDSRSGNEQISLERTSSTSIRRLMTVASDFEKQQDIYATVKAVAYSGKKDVPSAQEYRDSEAVSSNVANTLYADGTKDGAVRIAAFRHLSNMRYYSGTETATFTLTNRNMDWASVGTGVYDLKENAAGGVQKLSWRENSKEEAVDFPSIPELSALHTLTGKKGQTLISSLCLGEESVIDDTVAAQTGMEQPEYLGLFSEIYGNVQNVTLQNATLKLGLSENVEENTGTDSNKKFSSLKGVGILAGRAQGTLSGVSITEEESKGETLVEVSLVKRGSIYQAQKIAAVGGIVGIFAEKDGSDALKEPETGEVSDIVMEGSIRAVLPDGNADEPKNYAYGIGGIAGYAKMQSDADAAKFLNCANHASVTGNLMTGGIVGNIDSHFTYQSTLTDADLESVANIKNSSNDGLIVCSMETSENSMRGKYFGGIAGYADQSLIYGASSASGRAEGFTFAEDKKEEYLKGKYVGGIVGYGNSTLVNNCSTETDGYVLGSEYVGGIAGGLGRNVSEAIRADSVVAVTTNGSYIIGNSYVGGIVGENQSGVTLKNCINNGVAAGYDRYIGGIVGYNEYQATIYDCASYLSDYDNSIFRMIVDTWNAKGDYAGGIAGYNDGNIVFAKESEAITVKSVSGIVVGRNYVGGIAGFNDVNGELDVHYTLIGGRIYAYGDCAGGGFGLNASQKLLSQELMIKPRSINGRYYVGGCIGANVVELTADITMDQFRADNVLGTITGKAFCGGIIGYQRTYTKADLPGISADGSIREAVEEMQNGNTQRLLPGLQAGTNIPQSVKTSGNTYTLTLETADNSSSSLKTETNNIPIQAGMYAGGIIGYCEKSSKLIIRNCKNAGNISNIQDGSDDGVRLDLYAKSEEIGKSSMPQSADDLSLHLVGGIIGVNLENQVIDHCANTGSMSGYSGIGGVVGLNAGLIYKCTLSEHFGNAALNYLGGIAGINIGDNDKNRIYYEKTNTGSKKVAYTAGTIQQCSTQSRKTISGNSNLGGIVGWNLTEGILKKNTSYAGITASGDYAGGVAGRNNGTIQIAHDGNDTVNRSISAANGMAVGGIVGINEENGNIEATGTGNTNNEILAVGSGVSVTGEEKVGGIAGINRGQIGKSTQMIYLTSQAKRVRASKGMAGGVVGETYQDITYAVNRASSVAADAGTAGGITAVNHATIGNCKNYGNVSSSNGYVGGIAANNKGTIKDSIVSGKAAGSGITIHSIGQSEIGAVCAINSGTISGSYPEEKVTLQGDAGIFGGVTGTNSGTVKAVTLTQMPKIDASKSNLTVGGAVGANKGTVTQVKAAGNVNFLNFRGYRYLGGIVGKNGTAKADTATVSACTYSGTITEKTSAAGNCYGGIAGINYATLSGCEITAITMEIKGVYTATSTSTAEQKEKLASHVGGITGKNETSATITSCVLDDDPDSKITADYGMLGGVTGFNKGSIMMSGSDLTPTVMTGVSGTERTIVESLSAKAGKVLSAEKNYIDWPGYGADIENLSYHNGEKVISGRLQMYMISNGNLGGIAAYNGTTGSINQCVSGNWFLNNKSSAIGVGTGGIIGMNESGENLSFLVNGAFVGRQLSQDGTNRFAGGIIGNQNNTTSNEWNIENCINYGTIYCYRTHYSGGIMGQWTGTGGTIQNCRNYGMLQTTMDADWSGASGGIVAQLYHAQDDQDYNVIGCGNYAKIYTRNGPNADSSDNSKGANDSAGILGNITTYKATSADNAQSFNVQLLDCFNAPGAEIYSFSMSSGIFGFLSCDDASKGNIETSTQNVVIRIERCRNFGYKMMGKQYTAGIFGDRYLPLAWTNSTIVKDNYSVKGTREYTYGSHGGNVYPIYASGNYDGDSSNMKPENRIHNYYVEGVDSWGYSDVRIGQGSTTVGRGSGSAENGYFENGTNTANGNGRYCTNVFFMYDITAQTYFIARINDRTTANGITTVRGNQSYIDSNGYIVDQYGNKQGEVLYYIDNSSYDNSRLYSYIMQDITNPVFVNARSSYRRLEGIDDDKIRQPESAQAQVSNGKVNVSITPQKLHPEDLSDTTLCDPFAYEVEVTGSGKTVVRRIYAEEGSFNIPKDMGEKVSIRVRAVSMFDEVEPSEWITISKQDINKILPEPDVVVELVSAENTARDHKYRFRLNNLEDYTKKDADGNAVYPNWQVTVSVPRAGNVVLDAENPSQTMKVEDEYNYIYQMITQASSKPGNTTLMQSSKQISTAVSLPFYRPPITLKTWTPMLSKNVTITGTTLEDLTVNVELNAGNNAMDTPPVYRVELVGTWNGEVDTVLAKEDVLIVSKGSATATFSDLPEYIGQAKDIKVRIWYASSGLGPVYTYWDEDVTESNANVKELTDVDENGKETWEYSYSTTMEESGSGKYFENYVYWSGKLLDFLPAPVLDDVGSTLNPEYDENNDIYYTFTWDTGVSGTENAQYKVSLTGIAEDGREVVIDTEDAYKSGKSLRINGSDWNYKEVKLQVTRIGDETKKQIGLSSTGNYSVKQRLARPGQPTVENLDDSELDYQIRWPALASEKGCKGYQVYIQTYQGDTLGAEKELGELVTVDQKKNGSYSMEENLEEYAGKRIVLYLVAKADENSDYLDSVNGVTYEIQIPNRLPKPNVTWSVNWTYDKTQPVEANAFETGGLGVSLMADAASIPPGGSAYLLKAYVYDSEKDAAAATDTDPGDNYLEAYPQEGSPVQMGVTDSRHYYHNLKNLSIQYAGKWIVFYARISSGGGNVSSHWAKAPKAFRLPYVRLNAPTVSSDTKTYKVKAKVTENPDIPGEEKQWNAEHTVLEWNSVECADLYSIDLSGSVTDTSSQTGKTAISAKVRIQEMSDGTVEVQQYVQQKKKDSEEMEWVWKSVAKTNGTSGASIYKLDSYSVTISSNYKAQTQAEVYYELTLAAELEVTKNTDGSFAYTLKLPDAAKLTTDDGTVITHNDLSVTNSASFKADVTDNLNAQGSTAYAESKVNEIKWTN